LLNFELSRVIDGDNIFHDNLLTSAHEFIKNTILEKREDIITLNDSRESLADSENRIFYHDEIIMNRAQNFALGMVCNIGSRLDGKFGIELQGEPPVSLSLRPVRLHSLGAPL
jgi:hypothetical protein